MQFHVLHKLRLCRELLRVRLCTTYFRLSHVLLAKEGFDVLLVEVVEPLDHPHPGRNAHDAGNTCNGMQHALLRQMRERTLRKFVGFLENLKKFTLKEVSFNKR